MGTKILEQFASLVLPKEILERFVIVKIETDERDIAAMSMTIHLDERMNTAYQESEDYESLGFMDAVSVTDFPIRDARTREQSLVAVVAGTRSEDIIAVLKWIDEDKRNQVEEVTLDLSDSMRRIVRTAFPRASRVIDRFHIQKLACDAVQELRIKHRWDAMQPCNDEMEKAKLSGKPYEPFRYSNGDTRKELLIRSRYLLFKSADKWSPTKKERAAILFDNYPDIKTAYGLCHSLRMIFSKNTIKDAARLSMARWYNKVEEAGLHSFNVIAATFYEHYDEILNFYNNRSSNALAESFNAKIKLFRANLRGVVDKKFFLFRIAKLYAYPH